MSVKQGIKYDNPESAKEILTFIEFHRLNVDEMLEPPSSYSKLPSFLLLSYERADLFNQKRLMSSSTASSNQMLGRSRSPRIPTVSSALPTAE
jgi:hypothetical protein